MRVRFSGINPGDTKKRLGWLGSSMPDPRVIPHSDAAGVVDAAYATRDARPDLPFWPMLFDNVTLRLLGSDDFPTAAKQQAATDLTAAARDGALSLAIADPLPLDHAAEAHDRVDAGPRDRVLLAVDE